MLEYTRQSETKQFNKNVVLIDVLKAVLNTASSTSRRMSLADTKTAGYLCSNLHRAIGREEHPFFCFYSCDCGQMGPTAPIDAPVGLK